MTPRQVANFFHMAPPLKRSFFWMTPPLKKKKKKKNIYIYIYIYICVYIYIFIHTYMEHMSVQLIDWVKGERELHDKEGQWIYK